MLSYTFRWMPCAQSIQYMTIDTSLFLFPLSSRFLAARTIMLSSGCTHTYSVFRLHDLPPNTLYLEAFHMRAILTWHDIHILARTNIYNSETCNIPNACNEAYDSSSANRPKPPSSSPPSLPFLSFPAPSPPSASSSLSPSLPCQTPSPPPSFSAPLLLAHPQSIVQPPRSSSPASYLARHFPFP
jgi:hypothetical protein